MQKHKVAKSTKQKVKSEWKPTGRIFKTVGLKWIPTGMTFNLVGKPCPSSSSNDASAIVVPPGHILTTTVIPTDVPCPKPSLRYVNALGSLSKSMLNTKCHPFNLHDFGFEDLVIIFSTFGQFCDSDLEVAFRKHTCFVRNLEGVDLQSGSRGSNLYTISMADMMKSSPICLLFKTLKTKSWLWHRRLSYLNFGTINKLAKQGLVKGLPKLKYTKDHLCSACQMGKSKKESHPHNPEPTQVSLNATVRYLRTDNGTEFLNQTIENYTEVGITHNTTTARTPQINGVVERHNRTLVEVVRTILIFSKSLLFLWAEAVATACYTQNRSLIHTHYNKTPYELLRDRKPELKYLYVFDALCYPTNDFEDLGKLQPKADIRIFIGYSPSKKAYQIYNKRTRQIMETINIKFGELTHIAYEQHGSGPDLQGLTFRHISSGVNPSAASNLIFAATLPPPDTVRASSSSSTSIDKVAPSLTKAEPKNYKEAMEESCWIEAMQEKIHEFERLKVWELVPRPDRAFIISCTQEYGSLSDGCEEGVSERDFKGRGAKLDEDPNWTPVDPTRYRGMVGSLMYLTASRPDLVSVICICAWYQTKPAKKHLTVVKRLADIFTKALARECFEFLIKRLGMKSIIPEELKRLAESDEK
ncbi:retrovirus-related pol polyprotein from transposon TNT 1-94 [Tanacetum coccineum]